MEISNNRYTKMQKTAYRSGTTNHPEHNDNPDYWEVLLSDLKDKSRWESKVGLDFACGKGRNVTNMLLLCNWERVDGVDISSSNIDYCKNEYESQNSFWYCNNGTDVSELKDEEYDFIMSTIALQHIPVYDIRKSLITDLFRTLKPGGLFSFQLGFGDGLDSPIGKRSAYYDNFYDASGTNSAHDVRVQNESEVIDDLTSIGFSEVETFVRDSYSDKGHSSWIYVKAHKPK